MEATSGDFSVVTEEWALYLGLYVNTSYNAPLFPQNCTGPTLASFRNRVLARRCYRLFEYGYP